MKQLLVMLMFTLGLTSVAYAQEEERITPAEFRAQQVEKAQALRAETQEAREAALLEREEKKSELQAQAEKAKAELKAQFEAATTTEAREALREEAAEKKAEFQEVAQTYREEWRERAKEFLQKRVSLVFAQFEKMIEKANSADARIIEVVEKLAEQGIDTAAVEEQLDLARASIVEVEVELREINTSLDAAVESGSKEEVRAELESAKEALKVSKEKLQTSFLNVRQAIAELKSLLSEEEDEDEEVSETTE